MGYGSGVAVINESLVNCVVHATVGTGDPRRGSPRLGSLPTINMGAGGPDQVNVTFTNTAAAVTDTSFLISAFC